MRENYCCYKLKSVKEKQLYKYGSGAGREAGDISTVFLLEGFPRVTTNSYSVADHVVTWKRTLETYSDFGLFLRFLMLHLLLFLNGDIYGFTQHTVRAGMHFTLKLAEVGWPLKGE